MEFYDDRMAIPKSQILKDKVLRKSILKVAKLMGKLPEVQDWLYDPEMLGKLKTEDLLDLMSENLPISVMININNEYYRRHFD